MKKVLLLSANLAVTPYPVPPIGPALLGKRLAASYRVRLLDGLTADGDALRRSLDEFRPDYLGLSIRNIDDMVKGTCHSFIPEIAARYLPALRERGNTVLILGGAGFTIFPNELLDLFGADCGIVGEAEETLPTLLQALDAGGDISQIDGLVLPGGRLRPPALKSLWPDRPFASEIDTQIDYAPYRERGSYPIQTKRGCVHRCIYCSYPILEGRSYRKRTAVQVVDEIQATADRLRFPGLVFEFVDSTFNDPPGHAEAICEEIIKRDMKVALRTMGMNPANISGRLLELMQKAGFAQIDSTPDSASPTMLRRLGKNFSLAQLQNAARLIREMEMPTMWFFIFGGPGETEETLMESFAFIDRFVHPEDMVHITEGLRIYPRTPLADLALREGLLAPGVSLLSPCFYLSKHLGEDRLAALVNREIATRPNCIRLTESRLPPELLQAALRERKEKNSTEPMFRTLLRLKRRQAASFGNDGL